MCFVTIMSVQAQAQDTDTLSLERKLKQRDMIIIELLERVEALERRVGTRRGSTGNDDAQHTQTVEPIKPEQTRQQAPGVVIVDEVMAERALERSLTRDGALLLPSGILEFEPRLTYQRKEDSTPSFVMSGGGTLASETERNTDSLTANLALRLGLPWDSQLEIGLPYRWRRNESITNIGVTPTQASSQSGSGAGDVQLGLAKTILREGLWRPDIIGRLTWDTDTGNTSDGNVSLGGGFNEIQGSVTFIKRHDPVVFVGGLGYEYTIESSQVKPGPTYSANFGSYIALNPETSLRFALSAAYQEETRLSGNTVDGSDRTFGSLIIGGSTLLGPGTLLNLSVGIGLTDDADDLSVSLSLPVRLGRRLF
jgi:hypothetical protein